jgi:peptide/nickel transport system permease protein
MRRPLAIVCVSYLVLVLLVAIFAPIILPDVVDQQAGDLLNTLDGPSREHPLGTDSLGRDVLDRLLVGTRVTMIGVLEAVIATLLIALPLGLAAGYFGGAFDRTAGWVSDVAFSLPGIAIVLVVLSVFPGSMLAGMVALGFLVSPALARIVRSATLPIRQELYIDAARVAGLSHPYIIARHVLPRIAGPVIIMTSLFAATALLAQTGLAYLGLIATIPEPSWGGMVGDGIANIVAQPMLIWPPGIVMTLTIVAFGLLGDIVRDATTESWSAGVVRPTGNHNAALRASNAPAHAPSDALLDVQGLTVTLPGPAGPVLIVDDVSFDVMPGETVGIVGESGCGKTITALALLGLLPVGGEIVAGQIGFDGRDLARLSERDLRRVRGKSIGFVSQEPMISLNPSFRIGWQLALAVRTHHHVSRREASARVLELLTSVHLPDPEIVAARYPHELSGGMAQRVAIARALAGEPRLLIADEPTTALDVTVQADILDLFRELQATREMGILLVTHDWGVVADLCSRAVVMYAGEVVERAELAPMFRSPQHPYTEALLASNPHTADTGPLPTIVGAVPKPGAWPSGCRFVPRCDYATAACNAGKVPLEIVASDRETRCLRHEEVMAK